MADEDDLDDDIGEDEDGELIDGLEQKKFSGKKMVIAAVAALVLIGGGLGAFFMMGGEEEEAAAEGEEAAAGQAAQQVVFYELPEMLVNMNTGTRQASYLKLQVALELDDPTVVAQLDQLAPRVIDIFQVYLRQARPEDIDGAAGMFRLKEELLRRANASVAPIHINDILFREMLVQ